MSDFKYVGAELDLFAEVRNWKSYWSAQVRPFIQGDVLEAGAGIGSNTPFLDTCGTGRWVCMEPDPELIARLTQNLESRRSGYKYEALAGTLQGLGAHDTFDTIIYIDVLEHIEADREELQSAASRLRPGGRIIVLSPAHQWLFTSFDAAIGHFRRYNRAMLRAISPRDASLETLIYLDSAGLALSMGNRLFLRQSMPTKAQLSFWDKCVIPVSRVLDNCLFHSLGKSIVGVWRRN